jgi:uncharacterized protein (DUF1800 family)
MRAQPSHSLRSHVQVNSHGSRHGQGTGRGKNPFSHHARHLALLAAACLAPSWATAQVVTSFTVVNADTGADIATFAASPTGGTVSASVSMASTPRINVRVNASAVKSVVFADGASTRTESSAPYAYKGNTGPVYAKWQPAVGTYDINATPHAGSGGSGLAGPRATLRLTVVGTEPPPPGGGDKPATRSEAARFLAQATFGPTDKDITDLMNDGYTTWIEKQFNKPNNESHLSFFTELDAKGDGNDKEVVATFWKQALHGQDQLRLRMAYALSQIFVISLRDGDVDNYDRAVAAWLDMLKLHSFGNYRDLLKSVSLNPMMGIYLSHLANQKADAASGRVPDENYAREVMQLFSIGLVELNVDGSPRRDSTGALLETYSPNDVSELAKVFTGWSWDCPVPADKGCFLRGETNGNRRDPNRDLKPMVAYPAFHSTEPKSFLKLQIPPGTSAQKSLDDALDHLAKHANVAPFISRQLIQRFTTSNPSPAYVRAVANKFNDNGAGVRGDFKAVLKEVLLNPEARLRSGTSGKVREPVLRLSAFMRAFPHESKSKRYDLELTDSPATALGQAPLHSPSVFNFYRPGYVAPGLGGGSAMLVAPELQIVDETSVAGYVNFMRDSISNGVGFPAGAGLTRRDMVGNYSTELALAHDAPKLVDHVTERLTYGVFTSARRDALISAVNSIAIPAAGASPAQINAAKQQRVNAAILLTVASPEFIVTK